MRQRLPLFCYTAVGWHNEIFYVPAVRIEKDIRQESEGFDQTEIENGVEKLLTAYPNNRLVKQYGRELLPYLSVSCCT
ncbi:MAG: hypothetical protein WDM71_08575 [Ferruginibacter sp.]